MKTHVVTTILDDSISGDKIHGGDISGLNSLESTLLFVTGGSGSLIQATTIGGPTIGECAPVFANVFRTFSDIALLSTVDSSTLFNAYESGPKTVRGNYYDNGVNFVKISRSFIEMSPLSLRLMTASAAPVGYTTRTGGNWYFEGTANLASLIVRGTSTIPTGTFGGIDIATMASRHTSMWALYNALSADLKVSMQTWTGAPVQSIDAMLYLITPISAANWTFLQTLDQYVSSASAVAFGSVATDGLSLDTGDGALVVNKAIGSKTTNAPSYIIPGETQDLCYAGGVTFKISYSIWYPLCLITFDNFYITTTNLINGNYFRIDLPSDIAATPSPYQPLLIGRLQCKLVDSTTPPYTFRHTMLIKSVNSGIVGSSLFCEIVDKNDDTVAVTVPPGSVVTLEFPFVLALPLEFA